MESEGLESRVAALEAAVIRLTRHAEGVDERLRSSEQDAAAARVLAGAADRDVSRLESELRDFRSATVASMNAMREDLNDGFTEMRGKFDATSAGLAHVTDLLQTLIDRDQ